MAFIVLIGTALMFATSCSASWDSAETEVAAACRRTMYVLANLCFYLGVSMSWLGLHPLLVALAPGLWPGDATLTFAVVVFVVASLPFMLETNVIRFAGSELGAFLLSRTGSIVMPSYQAIAVTALMLLWLSLVARTP